MIIPGFSRTRVNGNLAPLVRYNNTPMSDSKTAIKLVLLTILEMKCVNELCKLLFYMILYKTGAFYQISFDTN